MTDTQRTYSLLQPRRLTRRGFAAGVAASTLGLSACSVGEEDVPDVPPIIPTEAPTQVPPAPTQEPIVSPVAGYQDPARWSGRSLTIATASVGTVLDAMIAAFFDAFAQDTGATVNHEQFGRDGIDNLIDQVEAGEVLWDVMLIPTGDVLGLSQGNYLSAIDYNVVDSTAFYPELSMQHGVGAALYSTTMVHSVSVTEPPGSWADFWNLDLFNGTRALRRSPVGTLEFALLADGVAMEDLYPLDIDRAFTMMERIRNATLFYQDSVQPVELVRTGQVGLASSWTVRTNLPEVASLVEPVWNQGMISADSWVTPRGSQHGDVAMSFINYATRAVPTANFSRLQPFGPANKDAFSLLREDIAESLPNYEENLAVQFFEDWSYWRDQREPLTAQFEDWLLNPVATPEES